jgi:hypothetical protein
VGSRTLPARKGDKSLDEQTLLEVSLLKVECFKGLSKYNSPFPAGARQK